MKKVTLFANASIASIVAATMIAVPALACKPVGSIVKSVQDQTTNSATVSSNSASSALAVNSGDTLVYTITIKNSGAAESNGDDDMLNVKLADTLPSGVQLISSSSQAQISESLGTIKPGASITKSYSVKVTDTNGDILTNKACYTGSSVDNKDNQSGCDTAVVKVNVPTPATPTPAPTPTTTTPTATPATMPDTGSTAVSALIALSVASVLGYSLNLMRLKRQSNS